MSIAAKHPVFLFQWPSTISMLKRGQVDSGTPPGYIELLVVFQFHMLYKEIYLRELSLFQTRNKYGPIPKGMMCQTTVTSICLGVMMIAFCRMPRQCHTSRLLGGEVTNLSQKLEQVLGSKYGLYWYCGNPILHNILAEFRSWDKLNRYSFCVMEFCKAIPYTTSCTV